MPANATGNGSPLRTRPAARPRPISNNARREGICDLILSEAPNVPATNKGGAGTKKRAKLRTPHNAGTQCGAAASRSSQQNRQQRTPRNDRPCKTDRRVVNRVTYQLGHALHVVLGYGVEKIIRSWFAGSGMATSSSLESTAPSTPAQCCGVARAVRTKREANAGSLRTLSVARRTAA